MHNCVILIYRTVWNYVLINICSLKVEVENLRKENQEKQDLLCQAVKAMELMDEEHKKYIANKEDEFQMCQQELEDLRIQLHVSKLHRYDILLVSTFIIYISR